MAALIVFAYIIYLILKRIIFGKPETSSESQPPKETIVDDRPWWEKPSNYEDVEKLKDYAYLFRQILPAIVAQKGSIGIYCSDMSNTIHMSIHNLDQVSDLYTAVQSEYASDTFEARRKYDLNFDQMDILRKMERHGSVWSSEYRAKDLGFFPDEGYRAMAEIIKTGEADPGLYTIDENRSSGFLVNSKGPYS